MRIKFNPKAVGDVSTASLVMSGANQALRYGARIGPIAGSLTGIGAIGLGVYSIHGLIYGKTPERRFDAAHGIAWSLQGAAGIAKWATKGHTWLKAAGATLGLAGGLLQAGLGAFRLVDGARNKDRRRKVLGALDLGAGLCWAASACSIATPVTLGSFAALTTARLAYANKDRLKRALGRLLGRKPRETAAPKPPAEDKPPAVIVTKPATKAQARRAEATGTPTVQNHDGKKALVTPATVETKDGREHPVVVVTPVAD